MNPTTIERRVRKGVEALDGYFGTRDWRHRLDLDVLDVGHPELCIVAQLFHDGWDDRNDGYAALTGVHDLDERESWRLGLIWGPAELSSDVVPLLNAEWRRQLTQAS